jgi:hypothetical protein
MTTPDPYDARDKQDAEAETRKRAAARADEIDDFKWLMGSKRGRRQVWRALERAGVFRTAFSGDALSMAFAEGSKREGYYLIGQIHTSCPERYHEMVKENANGK